MVVEDKVEEKAQAPVQYERIKSVRQIPLEEFYTSGHRTCQGCESAANTDIQATGMTTYGAQTTFTPPGKKHRIMQRRWKKNVAGMMAVGHPTCRYVATVCAGFPPLDFLNKVRKALAIGGPTFLHSFDPCPKGWDYHPRYSKELAELGVRTGIFPLYEVEDGQVTYTFDARKNRAPVREYLEKQGRFAHLIDEDFDYIQHMVDAMWQAWEIPGVAPLRAALKVKAA